MGSKTTTTSARSRSSRLPCPALPRRCRPCEALGRELRTLHTTGTCRWQIFFDYLARAYQLFLGGEDDTSPLEEQVRARSRDLGLPRGGTEVGCREGCAARETQSAPFRSQLAMIFEAKNASVKQGLETLTAANAELHEKWLGLTTGETPLEKQRSINAELLADEKKVSDLAH